MKKSIVILIVSLFGLLATHTSAAEANLSIKIIPAWPYVGEPVIYEAVPSEGNGNYQVGWWFFDSVMKESPDASPAWGLGLKFTNTFTQSGEKTLDVYLQTLNVKGFVEDRVERRVIFTVQNSRDTAILLLSPKGSNVVWEAGKTYPIRWNSTGSARKVQITVLDQRYSSELSSGEAVIAHEIPNDGSFDFTVPSDTNWISEGNIGGKNYRVKIYPWGGGGSETSDLFTITPTPALLGAVTTSFTISKKGVIEMRGTVQPGQKYWLEWSPDLTSWYKDNWFISGDGEWDISMVWPEGKFPGKRFFRIIPE